MIAPAPSSGIRIAIDRGGTFTDCIATVPGQDDIVIKLLSVDPANYRDAPVEAIRRVLEQATGKVYAKDEKISLQGVGLADSVKMGTTVATNALLERKGTKTAFVVTEGFRDLLLIGNQSRPKMFDLAINRPEQLYSTVVEASERVTLEAWTEKSSDSGPIEIGKDPALTEGITGEVVRVLKPLDREKVKADLQTAYAQGHRSLAVCLMHSYTFPQHERIVGELAAEMGFTQISLSSELMPMCKIVPRGHSANADAYLTPEIKKYIEGFESGFTDLKSSNCRCEFMQSDGGLVVFDRLSGLRAILSGPAGGVVGYAKTCYDVAEGTPVIGFDMGGTSTDVSRYAGDMEHIFESTTAGVTVQVPQLDINTVAAGGGSILVWRNGMLAVGPESAGSHPGPACYRKGGPLTVTDANLILGRILPDHFPKIFGPNENEPLDIEAPRRLFMEVAERINAETRSNMSVAEVAAGFLAVANEAMCRPIRTLTEAKGHDAALHNLASFGGAGGQHAASIATILGIKRILIHKYSSILSAYGMALADLVHEEQVPAASEYSDDILPRLDSEFEFLEQKAEQALVEQNISPSRITSERYLNLRYRGSDNAIMIRAGRSSGDESSFLSEFIASHHKEFGFTRKDSPVMVDDIRVRSVGRSTLDVPPSFSSQSLAATISKASNGTPKPSEHSQTYFEGLGWTSTPVFLLHTLPTGCQIHGPSLIIDSTQTILVTPSCTATVLDNLIVMDLSSPEPNPHLPTQVDPIQLTIFSHRFMSIAEQMGRALQKTSVSANIKERLDFTCAVFAPDGSLVANAPHVPAMIGSMAYAVKWQIEHWNTISNSNDGSNGLQPGDVILSNSPMCGGVHLPDLTTITPVFDGTDSRILFWTASRGHHADVGGIAPGSMPPNSRELWEEGAVFTAFKIVSHGGVLNEAELVSHLLSPAKYPGCSATRCLRDNVSDLRAQIAANQRGATLIGRLIGDYGLDTVLVYMGEIQGAAELAVRNLLRDVVAKKGKTVFEALDYMDDGSRIRLKVTIDRETGSARFDFGGTGKEVYGNWNAPIAITHSAILYALRCMVGVEIPLNQGALKPIDVVVPEKSLLRPSARAACCAGNVLTSQRIVDVIFRAFEVMAASQGCMNNFCFGSDDPACKFGYYETICGGSGAGSFGHGTSGVHTNMTNTRITDPEILERRYPVILRRFCLRPGSGGSGLYQGGDGVIRDVEFSIPLKGSILSERRAFAPYGMNGGGEGARGENYWVRSDGSEVSIGGKSTVDVGKGDRLIICTPGGGGWGKVEEGPGDKQRLDQDRKEKLSAQGNGSIGNIVSAGESA